MTHPHWAALIAAAQQKLNFARHILSSCHVGHCSPSIIKQWETSLAGWQYNGKNETTHPLLTCWYTYCAGLSGRVVRWTLGIPKVPGSNPVRVGAICQSSGLPELEISFHYPISHCVRVLLHPRVCINNYPGAEVQAWKSGFDPE